ncbi:flavin reductase family protein [Streptomyces subrutilus]|uniref:Monooxygenase n=2 Tax=Streptomyces subrutilus TaxID=36818 RepID=A0A918REL7_9ACTN|nr:flavin reductase family protein [Streptomyces subrutilus]WSJ28365.1 flavin reductase family protein [Streptomyces subrutilus]GGZ92528.1 monooxygenase [Streptomyces subrutilus]
MPGHIPSAALLDEVTQESFRDVLGNFCSGMTVITAMGADGPVGFTCQAFSSLSLQPPQVILCPGRTSTTWPLIRAVGLFCVNVLAEDQAGLSRAFARSGGDKFAGVRWDSSPNGSPILSGAAAWLDCRVHAEYAGGDHTVVRADVRGLAASPGKRPLLFHRGRYTRMADDDAPGGAPLPLSPHQPAQGRAPLTTKDPKEQMR